MKGLTLITREQARIQVLNRVIEREAPVAEAVRLMGVSERHTWRLLTKYRKEGVARVAHGNRGRRPSVAISPGTQEQVMALAEDRQTDFNRAHLTDTLAEREGIHFSWRVLGAGNGAPWGRRAVPYVRIIPPAPLD